MYISSFLEPGAWNWYTGNILADRYAKWKFQVSHISEDQGEKLIVHF